MTIRSILFTLMLAPALGGCSQRQPDFDTRYEQANARIRQESDRIDAQIAATGVPTEPAR
ncbi:MAG: hypothetical protein P8Y58_12055 [Novosphingobium sp.]